MFLSITEKGLNEKRYCLKLRDTSKPAIYSQDKNQKSSDQFGQKLKNMYSQY